MALIIRAYNPSRCGDCDLCELYTDMMTEESCYKCVVTTNIVDTEKKHYTCPIIGEIPDSHGELADKMDIIHRIEEFTDADLAQDIIGEILASPTIVEAST